VFTYHVTFILMFDCHLPWFGGWSGLCIAA